MQGILPPAELLCAFLICSVVSNKLGAIDNVTESDRMLNVLVSLERGLVRTPSLAQDKYI